MFEDPLPVLTPNGSQKDLGYVRDAEVASKSDSAHPNSCESQERWLRNSKSENGPSDFKIQISSPILIKKQA